ncbi:hypothetical protein [Streptomyces hokutonensis]|uniref:hypothetical protein n=1 Tax=Streptomyces hokutonensis TaxID=1306990 RepID=UPI00367706F3
MGRIRARGERAGLVEVGDEHGHAGEAFLFGGVQDLADVRAGLGQQGEEGGHPFVDSADVGGVEPGAKPEFWPPERGLALGPLLGRPDIDMEILPEEADLGGPAEWAGAVKTAQGRERGLPRPFAASARGGR